ncbi:MAG: integrase core domain-containing protein [Beijerinckiaceae bacterium]|nr:integrase core domain-containing protein [Beijerinckiaceae bacterium]
MRVDDLRNDNPMWGKRKIAVLLRREGLKVSVSTAAGRILAHLVKRGALVPVPLLRRRPKAKRVRLTAKKRDARRLPKGRKAKSPGELGQIDTLFVNIRPAKPIKHFTAYDPIAKWTIGRVCVEARATSAKLLLDTLLIEAPFPIRGIQVDGGAEFKSVFEQEYEKRGPALFVLPPKRKDLNGCVARAQSPWRYEVHAPYELPHRINKLQAFVNAFAHRFNHHRPHDALGGQTPAEHLQTLGQGDPPPSHMG